MSARTKRGFISLHVGGRTFHEGLLDSLQWLSLGRGTVRGSYCFESDSLDVVGAASTAVAVALGAAPTTTAATATASATSATSAPALVGVLGAGGPLEVAFAQSHLADGRCDDLEHG